MDPSGGPGKTSPPVSVVTGGASGIGRALARALGEQGDTVLLADIDAEALNRARRSLEDAGVRAFAREVDVRSAEQLETLAETACSLGPLRTICCNAGVSQAGPAVWETPTVTLDFVFEVNVLGLVRSIEAFVPRLRAQVEPSRLLVTASMAGMAASPGAGVYSASKAAAVALTKALRAELATAAPHVSVAVLNPGMVRTNLQRTSAARQPPQAGMDAEFVEQSHATLNTLGVDAAEAARWALDALAAGRFWAFPPTDDPFVVAFAEELVELCAAVRGRA